MSTFFKIFHPQFLNCEILNPKFDTHVSGLGQDSNVDPGIVLGPRNLDSWARAWAWLFGLGPSPVPVKHCHFSFTTDFMFSQFELKKSYFFRIVSCFFFQILKRDGAKIGKGCSGGWLKTVPLCRSKRPNKSCFPHQHPSLVQTTPPNTPETTAAAPVGEKSKIFTPKNMNSGTDGLRRTRISDPPPL